MDVKTIKVRYRRHIIAGFGHQVWQDMVKVMPEGTNVPDSGASFIVPDDTPEHDWQEEVNDGTA